MNGEELVELFDSDPIGWQATQATIGARVQNDFSLVQSFPGTIDELAIYDTLLSEDRIMAHYLTGIGEVLAPLDINELQDAIKAGSNDARFDLNGDGAVNIQDQDQFLEDNKIWPGDANLDGEFDSGDFVAAFTQGEYEDNDPNNPATIMNSQWEDGDWNADREFDSSDFVAAFSAGGYEVGPRPAVAAVPEPSCAVLLALGGLALLRFRR